MHIVPRRIPKPIVMDGLKNFMATAAETRQPSDSTITSSADSVRPLKMSVTSICLPKDNVESPLGEDGHFISNESKTIGVADGVSAWRKLGIDSGEYARRLMHNSFLALQQNPHLAENPKRVLEVAYRKTAVEGSSTACIVSFSGGNMIRAANVGDSGFLVVRNGAVFYRSSTQQRSFNKPYQLGITKDRPSVADEIEVRLERGDVVVVGTDGLFDNLHEQEITKVVARGKAEGKELSEQCSFMANLARSNSLDKYKDTPFSIASRMAGKCYWGGKVDDITVIMIRIGD